MVRRVSIGQRAVRSFFRQGIPAGTRGRGGNVHRREATPREVPRARAGDTHVIPNADGRVSEDAIRSLIISERLLGTEEIVVSNTPIAGC
jgi:hypothetical protein